MHLHKSLTLDVIMAAAEEQMFGCTDVGFCVACGAERDCTEPDARGYPCGSCGAPDTVYGAEELLLMVVA